MNSQEEGKAGWVEYVIKKLKPESDDIGCGCFVLLLTTLAVFLLSLVIPPILDNWDRPIKVGDLGRLFALVVIYSAFYFPSKFIFSDSTKATLQEKVKVFVFYVIWLIVLFCMLEYFLDGRGHSISDFFRKDSFRYLR